MLFFSLPAGENAVC